MNDLDALELRRTDAVFVDFDGTLAEIGADPDAIFLPPAAYGDLETLATALGGALAVISGRDLRDLVARTPDGIWRLGGHGLEVLPPNAAPPAAPPPPHPDLLAPLHELGAQPGLRLEIKGPVVALHYRATPQSEAACLAAAQQAARARPGHIVQHGKMVVEIKPEGANKGAALRRFAATGPFAGRRPVMLGDDRTDEDAMRAALDLGGLAVKIGDGESVAPLRAPDPQSVRAWITREAQRLPVAG